MAILSGNAPKREDRIQTSRSSNGATKAAGSRQTREPGEDPPEPRHVQGAPTAAPLQPVEFKAVTSEELDANTYELEYLIEDVLVRGQPGGIFGGKKSLKTTLMIDLALSLSIGGRFLNRFQCTRQTRVAVMSGESGAAVIQETARRIALSKGRRLGDFPVSWCFDLPTLGRADHHVALERLIERHLAEVLVIDPTYMAMPLGDAASNLFAVGALLKELTELAQKARITLLLLHHMRRGNKTDQFLPPELEEIAFSGFQEWVRQWILVGRRERYDPELAGSHRLWMNVGGSAGHSGAFALNVEEGSRKDPGGRRWDVQVSYASEAVVAAVVSEQERRATEKETQKLAQLNSDREKVLCFLARFPDGESKTCIRASCGMNASRFERVLSELLESKRVEACDVKKGRRTIDAYRVTRTNPDSPGQPSPSELRLTQTDSPPPLGGSPSLSQHTAQSESATGEENQSESNRDAAA
jgi:hypothetical protein